MSARGDDGRPRRRGEAASALHSEVTRLRARVATLDAETRSSSWASEAAALVQHVEDVLARDGDDENAVHEAWGWMLDARRKLVYAMDDAQVRAEAIALREEAAAKLRDWRRKTVTSLADEILLDDAPHDLARRRLLEQALRVRDGHSQNAYRAVIATRRRVKALLGALVFGIVAVIVAISTTGVLRADPDDASRALPAVLAFGWLGGSISAFRPLSSAARRYPEELARWYLTLSRPLLGAAAALALYPFVLGGFVPVELRSSATVVALALAAGFSERPLSRAVAAAGARGDEGS